VRPRLWAALVSRTLKLKMKKRNGKRRNANVSKAWGKKLVK
jgi:hypothetical protein